MRGSVDPTCPPPGKSPIAPPSPLAPLCFRSRGVFAIRDADGADGTPRGRKCRALVAYLACHAGEDVSRERIRALLWSERGEDQARASLRQCLHELRRCRWANDRVRITPTSVSIAAEAVEWDCDRLLGSVPPAGEPGTLDAWLQGDGLFLEGLDGIDPAFDEWLRLEREHRVLRERTMVVSAAETAIAQDDLSTARKLCTGFAKREPDDEVVAAIGMRADAGSGDVAGLRWRYRFLTSGLRSKVDAAPTADTATLFERLLENPATDLPASPSAEAAAKPPAELGTGAPAVPAVRRPTPVARWRGLLLGLAVSIVLGVVWWRSQAPSTTPAAGPTVIAVLPFRQLSPGEAFLADGLWEDTRAALSHNPAFHVLGRVTAEAMARSKAVPQTYRERFGVDYVLDGSVRRVGPRVKVTVQLLRTADGIDIWSAEFGGRLGNALALQAAVAKGIEGRIRGRLAPGGGTRPEQITTSPEVYALFSEARALLRERRVPEARSAAALLRRALAIDQNFAPAWASLGVALHFSKYEPERRTDSRSQALAYVRRALALAPNLAQGQAALAMIEGEDGVGAEKALERAVALDPGYAEAWMWLGNSRNAKFRQREAVSAYARAVEIDPLWHPAVMNMAMTLIDLGDRRGLDELVARIGRTGGDRDLALSIRGAEALARGDYAQAVGRLLAAHRSGAGPEVRSMLGEGLVRLGYANEAAELWQYPDWFGPALRSERVPPDEIAGTPVGPRDFWLMPYFTVFATRAMLNLGRGSEVVAKYRAGFRTREDFVTTLGSTGRLAVIVPHVAVALTAQGEAPEADYLLAAAERKVAARLANAPGHRELLWELGRIRAAQGRSEEALQLLHRAMAGGWLPEGRWYPLDSAQDPSFRALRGDRRFEALRARALAHIARERAELDPVRL